MAMKNRRHAVMQKVVQAAIDCMEEYGVQKTTIRAIAAKAGLNSAAINYYFKNKGELMKLALEQALKNAFGVSYVEICPQDSPSELLERLFDYWLQGIRSHPGIIRAYFYEPFVNQHYGDAGILKLKECISEVEDMMVRHGMARSDQNAMRIRWAFSAFLNNVLMPGLLGDDIVKDEQTGRHFMKLHYSLF